MNRVNIRDFSGADDPIDLKVTFCAPGRTDADSFVGQLYMQ
jgi:hypothetical protein